MKTEVKTKRKDATKEVDKIVQDSIETDLAKENLDDKDKLLRYGHMPTFPHQRVWTRGVMILSVLVVVYFSSKDGKEISLALQKDVLAHRGQQVDCSESYKAEVGHFAGCLPSKCGRFISDKLVTSVEADLLLKIAKRGLAFGGSDGGASILDLHSGALSMGVKFVNIYTLEKAKNLFNKADLAVYKAVKGKIKHAVAHSFDIDAHVLHLTHPTFFSRLTSNPPSTVHDEYWHPHVDKETYESFHYTSLLYLSDYGIDFKGGRFVFVDATRNSTVEPRKGRVSMFTSGAENNHYVEKVTQGTRYAITVSFTCDPKHAIEDPSFNV